MKSYPIPNNPNFTKSPSQGGAYVVKRLEKEIINYNNGKSVSFTIDSIPHGDTVIVRIKGADDTLYAGESFVLRFRFPNTYPITPPEVIFVPPHVPVHPHIYSNGHICNNILYSGWSPAMSIESVCLSLISMLSSCTQKKPPQGDAYYCSQNVPSPLLSQWVFHDDTC